MNKYLEKIAEMQEQDNHFWRNAAIGGATLGAVAGGAFLARKGLAKLRAPNASQLTHTPTGTPTSVLTHENFSSKSPAHKELHDDLEGYRKDVHNYHIFAEGNAQRIPVGVEQTLNSKYPKVLANPLMRGGDKYNGIKHDDPKMKAMADYANLHKVKTDAHDGWTSFLPDIRRHISETERVKARDIVAQHVKNTL